MKVKGFVKIIKAMQLMRKVYSSDTFVPLLYSENYQSVYLLTPTEKLLAKPLA